MGINFGIPVNTNQTEPPRLWTALRSRQDFVGGLVIIAVAAIGYWLGRGLPGGTDGGIGPGTLPNVPTTKEAGLPDYQVSAWNALFAPKGVPQDIAAKLSETLVQALDDEATRKRLLELGSVIPDKAGRSPQALADLVKSEIARWTPILKAAQGAQ